jgi:hypothetical protein
MVMFIWVVLVHTDGAVARHFAYCNLRILFCRAAAGEEEEGDGGTGPETDNYNQKVRLGWEYRNIIRIDCSWRIVRVSAVPSVFQINCVTSLTY